MSLSVARKVCGSHSKSMNSNRWGHRMLANSVASLGPITNGIQMQPTCSTRRRCCKSKPQEKGQSILAHFRHKVLEILAQAKEPLRSDGRNQFNSAKIPDIFQHRH